MSEATRWINVIELDHTSVHNTRRYVVADLQDPTGAYPETTAITETPDRLYVQSLHAHGLGWLPAR